MRDPWGFEQPPAVDPAEVGPLPSRLADLAGLHGRRLLGPGERWVFPAAEELPEIQVLIRQGWQLLDGNPLWSCLPAVWPPEHRCWVPDRRPRVIHCMSAGESWLEPADDESWLEPADDEELEQQQLDFEGLAADAGLPTPPAGRLWLLRSPWAALDVDDVRMILSQSAQEREGHLVAASLVPAAAELFTWTEPEVLRWRDIHVPVTAESSTTVTAEEEQAEWSGEWRRAGFADNEAAALLRADPQLTPTEAAAFAHVGLSPRERVSWVACGFSADEARAWTDLDVLPQEARVWRSLGRGPAQAAAELAARAPVMPRADGARLPADIQVAWSGYGTTRQARQYAVSDPPGTRGREAR